MSFMGATYATEPIAPANQRIVARDRFNATARHDPAPAIATSN